MTTPLNSTATVPTFATYESSKFGVLPEQALDLVKKAARYETLKIRGLMTIGAHSDHEDPIRKSFKLIKQLQQQIIQENISGVEMDTLSMGMSSDFKIALEEGSTLLRLGSAVFGERGPVN